MRRLLVSSTVAALVFAACAGNSPPDRLIVHHGADAGPDVSTDAPVESGDDSGSFLGGPCVDDPQCDDHIPCTYDSCDKTRSRCRNVPDSTQCQDGVYCNGIEQCVVGHGCEAGPVVSCDNGNACQTARCVEESQSCEYALRDADQDGDPDARCDKSHDCNDLDPDVSSLHAEVCANKVDDNCNGMVDESPCVVPQGDKCANAVVANATGTTMLSTVGCDKTFSTSCSVSMPTAGQNVVAAVTVPPGGNVDLDVWVSASVEVAVAIQRTCGDATTELACGSAPGATTVRARAYDVAPGTYYVVVTTQAATAGVQLQVDQSPASSPPTNVDCTTATPLTVGAPLSVSLLDSLPTQLPSACAASATTGQRTYSFTLAQAQDVRVYASTTRGSGTPVVGLRGPHCTDASDELSCQVSGSTALYRQNLPAATYFVTVSATAPLDAALNVETAPPTQPAGNQTCASPPAVTPNQTLSIDLSNHENDIKDGCFPSGPDAAYDLNLKTASDVLLLALLPQSETGGLSLDAPACDAASQLACVTGNTPLRTSRRNVRAGDFRVVIADQLGLSGSLDVLVRDTVAPTIVPQGSASTCAQAIDASAGGFFTGDTTTVPVGYTSGCDAPSGGEHVQVLSLNLAKPQRVVLDMEGSAYQTLLDVRQGPSCPGTAVDKGCYVAFNSQRSFLDLELAAGPYWILVSGYDGGAGPWDLDVRVLPP